MMKPVNPHPEKWVGLDNTSNNCYLVSVMTNTLLVKRNTERRTQSYIGTMKVNQTNLRKLKTFRKTLLKTTGQKVHVHGRHSNRKRLSQITGLSHRMLRQDVPIQLSEYLDVYYR